MNMELVSPLLPAGLLSLSQKSSTFTHGTGRLAAGLQARGRAQACRRSWQSVPDSNTHPAVGG